MHSSLKIVCNKENEGGGSLMFLKFLISLLKCSQFHNCIPYTDKKSFTFNTQSHVGTFFSQSRIFFPIFCRNFHMSDILAEPPFGWFINLLGPSTLSYQEENSIITAIQSVTIQTHFIDENAL